jgi:hypothetical protein
MEFSIGSQFSREFSFEESRITYNLAEELNLFFKEKDYGERIEKIYVGVICVSKGFEPFFQIRPLKILKGKLALEYEIQLDFETFKQSDEQKRRSLLIDMFLKMTKVYLTEKNIKGFEQEVFINDLENYFKKQSCNV